MGLAVMVKDFSDTDHISKLVNSLNVFCDTYPLFGAFITYRSLGPMMHPVRFAIMNEPSIWNFYGMVIATDLKSAKRLIMTPGPVKKLLYLWNLEWMHTNLPFSEYHDVYNHKKLELIVKNKEDAAIVANCWKVPSYIMDDYDVPTLTKIYQEAKIDDSKLPHYV